MKKWILGTLGLLSLIIGWIIFSFEMIYKYFVLILFIIGWNVNH